MKSYLVAVLAGIVAFSGCKGGENAEDAGAYIETSEAEVTAPMEADQVEPETDYRTEAGGTIPTDGM